MRILVTFILTLLVGVFLAEVLIRIGSLGREETPLEKRIREAMERNRKDKAA